LCSTVRSLLVLVKNKVFEKLKRLRVTSAIFFSSEQRHMQQLHHLIYAGDQIQWQKANQIICEKQKTNLAVSNLGTLIGLAALLIDFNTV